ncbi:MAG: DEAD/DEAH box helicase family protein [Atopobiaceae bacterium]|nr:DEAD/DEAH box helicase family protein [Atopobiaceae bacterium]
MWVFFDGAVDASVVRRVGEGLVSEARDTCTAVSFRSYDRLFPLQNSVGPGDLGSLIALPLQGEAARMGNSVFVDDSFEALPDQCAFLSTLPKANPSHIAALAEEFGEDPIGLPAASSKRLTISGEHRFKDTGTLAKRLGDSAPSMVQVTLSEGVRVNCDCLPAAAVNRLRRLAAFRNPEYGKRLGMHLSTRDVPRFVDLSSIDGHDLVLPRGCAKSAIAVLREMGIEPLIADGRAEGNRIHARFVGQLRATQEPCREKFVSHELGVLVAPTGFGKSVIAASVIATHQVSTLVIVSTTSLLEQWRESLTRFLSIDDEPPVLLTPTGRKRKRQPGVVGVIGGGSRLRSGIVDVALAGSLFERGEVAGDMVVSPHVAEYGMVIVDEAQHVAAAKVLEVLGTVRAHYVYAMTATPKRDDGLDRILFLECGPLRHEAAVADQIAEQGMRRLLVPRFSTSRPDLDANSTWHDFMDYISEDEGRNSLVASDAVCALRGGRTPLVLTRRVEHARTLAKLIETESSALGANVILLLGKDPDTLRRQRLEELRLVPPDAPLCVVATGSYAGEGFDLDRLDCMLLAGPVAFEGTLAQWVGRLHRVREGKADVVVMDYVDPAIPMLGNERRQRTKAYAKLGYVTAVDADLGLVGLAGRETPTGFLLSGVEFMEGLRRDVEDCQRRLTVASSWVRLKRVGSVRGLLADAVGRGAVVRVAIREPSKPSAEWYQILAALRDAGCDVQIRPRGSSALDVAVVDDSIVWYGGIAPLAFPRREDCSLRIVSREVAASLLEAV